MKVMNQMQLEFRTREIERLAINGDYDEAEIEIGRLERDMRSSPLSDDAGVNRRLMGLYTAVEQRIL